MKGQSRRIYRYSLAFQQKVVSEIEEGRLGITQAQRVYGINGTVTIQNWLRKFGKNHLLNKVVRIQMKDEKDELLALKKEKQRLESALAQTQLKVMTLESLIEVAEEHYRVDIKKNFGGKLPDVRSAKRKV